MKKIIIVGLALAISLAFSANVALAAASFPNGNNNKVEVCHIIAANDVIPFGPAPVVLYFGKVIEVSANAVPAHLAHGDSTAFWSGEAAAGPINLFRAAGFHLPAADCYYGVKPDGGIVPVL